MSLMRKIVKLLPKSWRNAYWARRKKNFFKPENQDGVKQGYTSPSGRYRIEVASFGTGSGTWNYTQGSVYHAEDNSLIAVVQRNYSSFPFLFVEDHPKGDFLICGEDYQGQTVVDLITGQVRNNLSDGTDQGFGFCWSDYTYNSDHQILVVCGCHWACPYEYRFYDFSDPMNGWTELEMDDWADADKKEPELLPDGTIKCYETRYIEEDDDEDESDPPVTLDGEMPAKTPAELIVDVIKTFRREGNKLVLTDKWESDYRKKKNADYEEYKRKDEEWTKNFKANDPLYLVYDQLVKDPKLKPETYCSVGQTYDGWAKGYDKPVAVEKRWCRRIYSRKKYNKGYTIDLEWGVETGPIKLVIYKNGNTDHDKFFEHSPEGMRQAFDYAKQLVK